MAELHIQDYLFQRIREKLSPDISLSDRVAEVLFISADSAYRRIRGETPLVLEEAKILCEEFSISLDELLKSTPNSTSFTTIILDNSRYSFRKYLEDILNNLKLVASVEQKEILYLSKDIVLFNNFLFRPLFAFRYFFWMKSILQHPDFISAKYSEDLLTPEIEELGKQITSLYASIPSTEIWNTECVNSSIAQIEYYREAGYFKSKEEVESIYSSLRNLIEHLRVQAELGCKFLPGENPLSKKNNFSFFHNRVVLGDNSIMALLNGKKILYLNYDVLNYMITEDERFCNDVYAKLQNLIKRATILSNASEKQRNIFFNILLRKIPNRKTELT